MEKEKCANCKFSTKNKQNTNSYLKLMCRRYPPSFQQKEVTDEFNDGHKWVNVEMNYHFPEIYENEWCGEYVRKTE